MKFFPLDASLRTAGSVSRALADSVEQAWQREHPRAEIIRRDSASTRCRTSGPRLCRHS